MNKKSTKFYQAGDGSWFYSADDAIHWDKLDKIGQSNLLNILKIEWAPQEISQSKFRHLIQDLNLDEFEDFMSDILGFYESFEEMVYEHEGNINLNPQYLENCYPEDQEKINALKEQIKQHKQWKIKHQASYSFLSKQNINNLDSENHAE